ncbi:MAG: low molecular weight protein arginine phosphatase [Sumerlaeia bacterium]
MLLKKRKKKRSIVFVCTGNTCRSPMAQGLMYQILAENDIATVDVKTAGVMTTTGLLPTPEAIQVMEAAGIDITKHRSVPLTAEMLRKADLVLGMTPFHVQFAKRMLIENTEDPGNPDDKVFLLKEYTKSDMKNYQITDPMGATLEVYKRVFREIKLSINKLFEMDVVHAPLNDPLQHIRYSDALKSAETSEAPSNDNETGKSKKSAVS